MSCETRSSDGSIGRKHGPITGQLCEGQFQRVLDNVCGIGKRYEGCNTTKQVQTQTRDNFNKKKDAEPKERAILTWSQYDAAVAASQNAIPPPLQPFGPYARLVVTNSCGRRYVEKSKTTTRI
jgi:hypothetical protein